MQCSSTGDCDSCSPSPPLSKSGFQTLQQQRRSSGETRRDGVPCPCNGDPWRKTEQESSQGGSDEANQGKTEAHQGRADEAEIHQGGTEADQGGADEAETHQSGADEAEAHQVGTEAHQGGAGITET